VFHISFGGAWSFIWGRSPPNSPVATGLGTCSSDEMLKGYMLIYWSTKGVHAHLLECSRGYMQWRS